MNNYIISMLARFVSALPTGLSNRITKFYYQVILRNQQQSHSVAENHFGANMDVKVIPALSDNYMYLIVDKATKQAAVVDPVVPATVLESVKNMGANLTMILTTHHHWDHAGGNEDLKKLIPNLKIYGGDSRIGALTDEVKHFTQLNIGSLKVQCLSTPCHTSGHICYYVTPPEGNECAVFTGDTLFLGGCGRFFEGTGEQMYNALINILSKLPENTKVYCGHEYSLQNLKFAAHVEPKNTNILKKIEWSEQQRQKGLPTIPSTIGEEKLYNPFMRVTEPTVMYHAHAEDPVSAMTMIRREKDSFT